MKRHPSFLAALLACGLAAAPVMAQTTAAPDAPPAAEAPEKVVPDYIRFRQDDKSARMELAVRTFTREDGTTVDLVGVVHIADTSYYDKLNKRLAEYDAVLYELVGDPEKLKAQPEPEPEQRPDGTPRPKTGTDFQFQVLHVLYDAVGNFLKLSFQLQHIDYTSERFIHADVSSEEFARLQDENGESLLTFMAQGMAMQNGEEMKEMQELDLPRLLMILMSPKAADEFKVVLARMMAKTESLMSKMEDKKATVILSKRNAIALDKLRATLATGKYRRLAVFYGAAHMPGMEEEMTQHMGFRPTGETWMAAWTMDVPARPEKPAAPPVAPEPEPEAAPEPAAP